VLLASFATSHALGGVRGVKAKSGSKSGEDGSECRLQEPASRFGCRESAGDLIETVAVHLHYPS
jgi:hypothetical protein